MAGAVQQNPIGIGAQCVRAAAMALQGLGRRPSTPASSGPMPRNIDSPEVMAVLYQ